VVEGVEGAVGSDRDLGSRLHGGVLDRDGKRVLARVPEQRTWMPSFSRAASSRVCGVMRGFIVSSCHGISTSLTLVAVVRSAT
jgi:hypothetical protein